MKSLLYATVVGLSALAATPTSAGQTIRSIAPATSIITTYLSLDANSTLEIKAAYFNRSRGGQRGQVGIRILVNGQICNSAAADGKDDMQINTECRMQMGVGTVTIQAEGTEQNADSQQVSLCIGVDAGCPDLLN